METRILKRGKKIRVLFVGEFESKFEGNTKKESLLVAFFKDSVPEDAVELISRAFEVSKTEARRWIKEESVQEGTIDAELVAEVLIQGTIASINA